LLWPISYHLLHCQQIPDITLPQFCQLGQGHQENSWGPG
jgi:hypothetical protein